MTTKDEKTSTPADKAASEGRSTSASVIRPVPLGGPEARTDETTPRDVTGPAGIEQIREILFGALFRELERKLARTDSHTTTRSRELEQEARKRTEVLEAHLRTEIGALSTRVEHALVEAADALRSANRENREALSALEKRIAKAEEAGANGQRDLRTQMLEQAKSFLDELQKVRAELLTALQEELGAPEGGYLEERGGAEERPRH